MVSDKLKIPWRAGMRMGAESLTKVAVISSAPEELLFFRFFIAFFISL